MKYKKGKQVRRSIVRRAGRMVAYSSPETGSAFTTPWIGMVQTVVGSTKHESTHIILSRCFEDFLGILHAAGIAHPLSVIVELAIQLLPIYLIFHQHHHKRG